MVAGQRRRAKRNSRPFFFQGSSCPPPLGPSHLDLGHAGRDCPRSAPRCIRHLQLASRANSTAIVRHTEASETACLPPSIHSLVHFLPSLPTPVVTYQPIPSHLSCACAALRCAPDPNPIHSLPRYSRVPFFDPTQPILEPAPPKRSFPARPSTAAAPHHYIYLGTPQVARVRQLPGRARLPYSHPHLPPRPGSTRLDWTAPATSTHVHARLSPPPRSFLRLCNPPSNLSACRGNHQTGTR